MAFMLFMVKCVESYCTMKITKSTKVKINPGNGRGLPCPFQSPLVYAREA
jgi:hypothetical protein